MSNRNNALKKKRDAQYAIEPYRVEIGKNGCKFVDLHSVVNFILHVSFSGNDKTGSVMALNLPVEKSCDHRCECYDKKKCYACGGHYNRGSNQVGYAENLAFFLTHTSEEFIQAVVDDVKENGTSRLFRWFTCGDILNERFLVCMIEIAKRLKHIRFWTYTKKYKIVNNFVSCNGLDSIPENLVIIYSHWMNEDGSYFPMENPYEFPTSEFIPFGREDLIDTVSHLCPCSNPMSHEKCATCENPCYELKHGQSMGLVEHSTPATRARDVAIKAFIGVIDDLKSWLKSFSNR